MQRLLPISLAALACFSGCRPSKAPAAPQHSQGQGYQIDWDAQAFRSCVFSTRPRLTAEENGTDIPIDVAPQRVRIDLMAPAPRYWVAGEKRPSGQEHHLELIPLQDPSVADFAKAYPDLTAQAQGLRDLLTKRPTTFNLGSSIPEWDCIDVSQTIHAKVTYLDTPWCSGIFFITQHTQETGVPINNEGLVATFQGLSKDGKVYIETSFPICHPAFTKPYRDLIPEPQVEAAHRKAEQQINGAKNSSFSPSLQQLTALITSLRPVPQVVSHVAPKP